MFVEARMCVFRRDAFATTLPLLRALSEAGVKHRALFPRNVIVTKGLSGYGEVPPTSIKLIDFMWAGMAGFPQPSAEHLSKHAGYTMSPDW